MRMVQPTFAFANGNVTADVEFPANTEVPPPNPQFLNVHAAFAKVLACSEVAEYVERIEMRNESGAPTDPSCWLPHLSIFPDCLSEVFTSCLAAIHLFLFQLPVYSTKFIKYHYCFPSPLADSEGNRTRKVSGVKIKLGRYIHSLRPRL